MLSGMGSDMVRMLIRLQPYYCLEEIDVRMLESFGARTD